MAAQEVQSIICVTVILLRNDWLDSTVYPLIFTAVISPALSPRLSCGTSFNSQSCRFKHSKCSDYGDRSFILLAYSTFVSSGGGSTV